VCKVASDIPPPYTPVIRRGGDPWPVIPERRVRFSVRTILAVLGVVIAVWALLNLVLVAREVLTWMFVALFLALAMGPAVDWLQRKGVRRRGNAVTLVCLAVVGFFALVGALVLPPLVDQVNEFARAIPDYVDDLTKGRGRLGFLQEKYHIVDRIKEAVQEGGASKVLGLSGAAIEITRSVITILAAIVTIAALTFFMLLEGPAWMSRIYSLFPPESQPRWQGVGRDIARAVGGYVSGNLLISLIAGISSWIVLYVVGVPFALALALLVAILDLVPLVGATIAAIICAVVAFLTSTTAGIVVVVFFIVYQQLENHALQPTIYSRTVRLSPLTVLIAVLIGASVAGVLGVLGAIPIAGAIQVLIVDYRRNRVETIAKQIASGQDS
jgi:predicted PurR-regulated permease PerM